MNPWSVAAISLLLLLCTAAMMVSHVRAWRRVQKEAVEAKERDYRWRQFRRRVQSTAMLALAAIAILVGQWITGPPWAFVAFWGGVLLLVVWVTLLALCDILATKFYFGRVRQQYRVEEVKLQAELRRVQAARCNGHANGRTPKFGPGPGGQHPGAKDEE